MDSHSPPKSAKFKDVLKPTGRLVIGALSSLCCTSSQHTSIVEDEIQEVKASTIPLLLDQAQDTTSSASSSPPYTSMNSSPNSPSLSRYTHAEKLKDAWGSTNLADRHDSFSDVELHFPQHFALIGTTSTDSPKDTWSVAWSGLETTLRVLEKSADAFPPLKSAVGGLVACLDIVQAAAANHEEYEGLAAELTTMASALRPYAARLVSEDLGGSVARILLSIKVETEHIDRQQARGKGRRIIESTQDRGDVIRRYHRIESLFRQLQNDIQLRTWGDTSKQREKSLLQGLAPVHDAVYNSGYSTTIDRRGCTPHTREKVLEDIYIWTGDPSGASVYWMNGMAGTGKTTIVYSLCEWLKENGRLGANYCCSRISSSCRDVNNIVPTIAYHLALYSPAFRSALCELLEQEPDASKLNVGLQFRKLVQEPMQKVKCALPEAVVVVIDALDECDNGKAFRLFLETLLRLAPSLPLKFFLTSRPEPAIRDEMLALGYSKLVLHLHDIEQSIVEADIKKYFTEALGSISPPLSSDQVERLAKRAGRLFIYAATAVRYILPHKGSGNPYHRLRTVLETASSSTSKRHSELDGLYTGVLTAALNDEDLEIEEVNAIRLTLWSVVCAKEPVTGKTLALLLGLTEEQVWSSLKPLRSVLHVEESSNLVSALHASFPDYMFDEKRSGIFYCNRTQHNGIIADGCFRVMEAQLRFNICNLESSFAFDKDVPDLNERIKNSITGTLLYACRYWSEHLRQGDFTEPLHDKLVQFLTNRLLFWMEVLNLKWRMAKGTEILRQAYQWVKLSEVDTRKQVADAELFVTRFTAGTCTRSTPHIYISGLPFCSKSSPVYQNYWGRTRGLVDVKGSAVDHWDRAAIGTWKTDSRINSVAFSPDGTRIVSGSSDWAIQIWDASSGAAIAEPFKGHTNQVLSVAFSPNSNRVVSGSEDHTIRVWDARTGALLAGPFEGHTHPVLSVAFSPDGIRIISGSKDGTIRLWDAQGGDAIAVPFEGHTKAVRSVAFSPDGDQIVSGSDDRTIRVWDARRGTPLVAPFQGNTDPVSSVAFSPNGTHIVSGSEDGAIRLWDTHSGKTIAGPLTGHTEQVTSVAFSSDGTHIVSGSKDETIRVWDAKSGSAVAGPFKGHTNIITSVAFSPDCAHIVSGSYDHTIRVWDAYSDTVNGPFEGHTKAVRAVAFSPDGTHFASGSYDHTIRVWDANSSDAVTGPFKGHTKAVRAVAFSPDGARIVSGSADCTIRVWDACTGNTILRPFEGHTDIISSVAFSPDGTRIVSGSEDLTIRVWDALSGICVAGPFTGHTKGVRSVVFSPDGAHLVSGSYDCTVRVWDAGSGAPIGRPFEGHTNEVSLVAYSPDGAHIISGSYDFTIRVWDAQSGVCVTGPFKGHINQVLSVAYSPDGNYIVSGSEDHTIRVWDAHSGTCIAGPFEGHTRPVLSVAFSPDGHRVISGSGDCAVRVWDARSSAVVTETFSNCPPENVPILYHCPHGGLPYIENFKLNTDGWMTAEKIPIIWVAPHFQTHFPHPRNTLLIGPEGTSFVDYHQLNIGETWSNCYSDSTPM